MSNTPMPTDVLFDAHLDLAMLAVLGRDMEKPLDRAMEPCPPAAVTLPALAGGGVRFALGTIFTMPREATSRADSTLTGGDADAPISYTPDDADEAHRRGVAQLEVYRTWRDRGHVAIDLMAQLRVDPHVGAVRGGMGVSEVDVQALNERVRTMGDTPALRIGILMENADPIRTPDELGWWVEQGVVAVGLAWWASSRYASGNGVQPEDDAGITDLGRELVREADRLGVVHDQSHLSDRATADLFEHAGGAIIASHSNCRAIVGTGDARDDQRHLSDDTIRAIAGRGGMIGLNLCSNFIRPRGEGAAPPSVSQALDHVEHVCMVAGNDACVGLGTDLDGGFSADEIPEGIDQPRDLWKLCEGLRNRGWNDEAVEGFSYRNWLGFFEGVSENRARA